MVLVFGNRNLTPENYASLDFDSDGSDEINYFYHWGTSGTPSLRHGPMTPFSFGDGHVEAHKWVDKVAVNAIRKWRRTKPELGEPELIISVPGSPDLEWFNSRMNEWLQ